MFLDVLAMGGAVGWVIVGAGVLAFGVFVERSFHLHRARIKSEDFVKGVLNVLRRGNVAEAMAICEDTPGPVANLARTAILHRHEPPETLRAALDETAGAEVSRMQRRLVVVATVAQLAPLLGLLGTVLGMIETVIVLQNQGELIHTANVMEGLLKALVTTAAGLTVAIPCYAAFNLLVLKIDRIALDMQRASSELLASVGQHGAANEQGSPA
jgi:biopolymer transport protein ExbB